MRILVAGGDGFCGWPTALYLSARGHDVSIVDNYSRRGWDEELGTNSLTEIADLDTRVARWKELTGREIEVAVLGNRDAEASVPGEIVPGNDFYDYEDKYVEDSAKLLVPAPLDDEQTSSVRALAVRVYGLLRCEGMARVDFFLEEHGNARGFLVNEVNTIPGFTPISMYPRLWEVSGLPYAALLDRLIDLALARHARRAARAGRQRPV